METKILVESRGKKIRQQMAQAFTFPTM